MSDPARPFLAAVLPWTDDESPFFVIQWFTPDKKVHGRSYQSLDKLCEGLTWLKKQDNVRDLYICMSSQLAAEAKQAANGYTYYWAKRSVAGAVRLKSLFIDVDVKKGAYASTYEAYVALKAFMVASGMPRPTVIVETGSGGFHCHWVLDTALKPEEWKVMARALENACVKHGLMIDKGISTDAARILRIPGTLNYKHTPPKPVAITTKILETPYPVAYLEQILAPYATIQAAHGPTPGVGGDNVRNLNTDELGAGIGAAPPFSFPEFRSAVEFLDQLSPSHFGEGEYDNMRTLTFACCFIELEHPMDATATQELFAEIVQNNGRNPETNAKRYASALQGTAEKLRKGEEVVRPATIFKQAQEKGWTAPKPDPGTPDPDLPPGYTRQADGTIWRAKLDIKTGLTTTVSVSQYPMQDAWVSKDPLALNFVTKIRGKSRTVSIAAEKAARKETVAPTLAAQGFILKTLQVNDAQEFILSWITHLQNTRRISSAAAFGWTEGGFAYGGQIYTPTGTHNAGAADLNTLRQYDPCGDLQVWKDAAMVITDQKRPALDAILASAFAGPLVKLIGQDGLLCSAYSPESGFGKTTALRVAQSVWGHPVEAAQVLSDTYNSVVGKLGEIRNLPLYWDEIKSEDQAQKFVDIAFQLSTGREKTRMTQNAVQRRAGTWETLLMSCSNDSIAESIADVNKGSPAGLYRCFEFRVPGPTTASSLSQPTVSTLIGKLKANFGQAGVVYANYLGSNAASVEKTLLTLNERLVASTKAGKDERFWVATITALVGGAMFSNALLLTQIDVKAMLNFLVAELGKLRISHGLQSTMVSISANMADVLSLFLRDMRARHTLFTNVIHRRPGKPPSGVVNVVHSDANLQSLKVQIGVQDRMMRVVAADFNDWLKDKKFSKQTYHEELKNQFGMIHMNGCLGSGTPYATGQGRCLEFNLNNTSMQGFFDSI